LTIKRSAANRLWKLHFLLNLMLEITVSLRYNLWFWINVTEEKENLHGGT